MTAFKVESPLAKIWRVFRTRVLTLGVFMLLLQCALLVLVLLDTNATLLLKREVAMGHAPGDIPDWVTVGAAVVESLLGALLGWWGGHRKNLALSFWFTAAAASGLLVLAFPYERTPDNSVELCGGDPVSGYSLANPLTDADPWVAPRIAMLCITAALCSLTRLSIWAHGLTYLDEHEPENGAYVYGILVTIRLSLGLNGANFLTAFSTRDTWWHYHLALCMLMILSAFLFTLFPTRMDRYKLEMIDDDELISKGFLATMSRVISDKTIVVQTLALAFLHAALFSFLRFDKDFVKAQFHIETDRPDPRATRAVTDIFRSLVIIFFVMVFRTRFSGRRVDGVKAGTAARVGGVVAITVAVPFVILAVLRCGIGELADGSGYLQPECSVQCSCVSESYGFSPVCALNTSTTYFSPCHAGCQSYEDLNGFLLFDDCSCSGGRAARGACSLPGCGLAFNVYQLIFALVLAMSGAALMMQGMSVLRSALVADRAAALGASYAVVALLSHVPGYLLYMLISHLTCAYSHNGGCLLHHPTLWAMAVLSAGLSVVSGGLSLYGSRLARGPS